MKGERSGVDILEPHIRQMKRGAHTMLLLLLLFCFICLAAPAMRSPSYARFMCMMQASPASHTGGRPVRTACVDVDPARGCVVDKTGCGPSKHAIVLYLFKSLFSCFCSLGSTHDLLYVLFGYL
jgi:hypothetical protein